MTRIKKVFTAVAGGVLVMFGLVAGSAALNVPSVSDSNAIRNVTATTPIFLTGSSQSTEMQWGHESHASHASHVSHASHFSSRY